MEYGIREEEEAPVSRPQLAGSGLFLLEENDTGRRLFGRRLRSLSASMESPRQMKLTCSGVLPCHNTRSYSIFNKACMLYNNLIVERNI
jgi:hypothetical protein